MSRPLVIPDGLRRLQASASDPAASAWVSANAGSGKTHVLTQRVLRLLLEGAPPAQILGLTFTKAAAANMASRIFRTLSDWTSLDDEALTAAILACGAERPGPAEIRFARQLFARTIETPGGLKIQTLHAFCERLLQLFPFEANVPAHFKVIDESEAGDLMSEATDRAIAAFEASSETAAALDFVAREAGAFTFDALLREAQNHAETFAAFGDGAAFAAALRGRLGLEPGATRASVEAEMLGGDIGRRRRQAWAQALDAGKTKDQELAAKLRATDDEIEPVARIEALLDAFFIKGGEGDPRGGEKCCLTTKDLRQQFPSLETDLHREQDRLITLREKRRAAQTLERSEALFRVAKAILSAFARAKSERGALDFNDQITLALGLVERSSAAWVLHKLDYGLDHLLVDEAQDTSAEQWRIIAALTAEFFAGAGARSARRTVFAVGDEKQSIFSFQGAAPEKFAEMRRFFEKRHREAKRPFETAPLNVSFRSAPAILAAVDKTFELPEAWRGVAAAGEPYPAHEAIRREMNGVVELWPPVKPADAAEPEDWRMPLDEPARHDPPVLLAGRIAETIERWLKPDIARARGRRKDRRAPSDPAGRRDDPGPQPWRLLRGDDPRAEEPERQGRRRRPAEAQRAHCGDGPRRRRARGADPQRRPGARLRPQVPADRTRRRRSLQARGGSAWTALVGARRFARRGRAGGGKQARRVARPCEDPDALCLLRLAARRGGRPKGAAFAARSRRGRSDRRVPVPCAGPRAGRSAIAHALPCRGRGDRGRNQARHGGRKRRRARVDGPREQGPRSADRLPARHVRGSRWPA